MYFVSFSFYIFTSNECPFNIGFTLNCIFYPIFYIILTRLLLQILKNQIIIIIIRVGGRRLWILFWWSFLTLNVVISIGSRHLVRVMLSSIASTRPKLGRSRSSSFFSCFTCWFLKSCIHGVIRESSQIK